MFTDVNFKIINFFPKSWHKYLLLIRLDRPTGIYLLYLPCLFGIFSAVAMGSTTSFFKEFNYIVIFFIGSFFSRSASCIWNDIVDRKIDVKVERTKNRPIASGDISIKSAVLLAIMFSIPPVLIYIYFLNLQAKIITVVIVLLIIIYPFMKRFINWPQLVLGIAINGGLLIAYVNYSKLFPSFSILIMYVGLIIWTIAYDTLYAFQDIKDDINIDVKSTARKFNKNPKIFIAICYLIFWLTTLVFYILNPINMGYLVIDIIALLYIIHIIYNIDDKNQAASLNSFKSNTKLGLILLIAFILA